MTPPSAGRPGHQLPDVVVLVGGTVTPVRELKGSVLALVPPHCRCAHLRQLALEANRAAVQLWVIGTRGTGVSALVKRTGLLSAEHAGEDTENALNSAYHPQALTAVLVKANGSVAGVVPDRGKGFQLTSAMRSLVPVSMGPRPGGSAVASVAASPAGS
jgi:hypothetical protein